MNMTTALMMYTRSYHSYGTRAHVTGGELLLFIAMLALPLIAQAMVKSTYSKYSRVNSSRGLTAAQAARQILDSNGLYHISIEHISGNLTDHFDPRTNVIRLSDSVYNSTSVAAIGVAAHECGHAVQHAEHYAPIELRSKIVPAANFCGRFWYFAFIIGIILAELTPVLMYVAIAMFAVVVLFQLITLPTEFDASSRALKTIETDMILDYNEVPQAKKVLTAAAMTYVANLAVYIMQLIRLLSNAKRR